MTEVGWNHGVHSPTITKAHQQAMIYLQVFVDHQLSVDEQRQMRDNLTVILFPRTGILSRSRTFLASGKPAALLLTGLLTATVLFSPVNTSVASTPVAVTAHTHRWYQIGKASWYGQAFQGKRTATGERFNMNSLTCAHRTLPLGSWLRVTNLLNSRSTFVRVNDRGPYEPHAIVDLSFAAAQKLGLLGNGQVRVEQVRADDPELAHALIAQLAGSETPLTETR